MFIPKDAQYIHQVLFYKRGFRNYVYRYTDFGWVRSAKKWSEIVNDNYSEKLMKVIVGRSYKHINGKELLVLGILKIKIKEVWHPGVYYSECEDVIYARTIEDFKQCCDLIEEDK